MTKRRMLLAAMCLLAASGCSKKEEKEPEPVAPVQVQPVRLDTIRRIVEADAVLYPRDQSGVVPKISAPVRKFYVNRGDRVKSGQLLASLEDRDLVAAVAGAKAQVQQAEANLRGTSAATVPESVVKAQTDVQSTREQLDAASKLFASRQKLFQEGALARRMVDEAQVSVAQAKAQYESAQEHLRALQSVGKEMQIKTAQAQLEAARAQLASAAAQVAYAEIRSPISGIVADRPLYAGEMAAAGTPLLNVIDTSRVVARANVPETEVQTIKVGDAATIRPADGSAEVPGRVTVVSPAADPSTTTVQVWVEADNPGGRLKTGAGVRVEIVAAVIQKAVVVPPSAILPGEDGGAAVLAVGSDNVAHLKKVETGARDGDRLQIVSGVAPGEQVVTVGGVGLATGAKVRIVKSGDKEEDEKKEESKEK